MYQGCTHHDAPSCVVSKARAHSHPLSRGAPRRFIARGGAPPGNGGTSIAALLE